MAWRAPRLLLQAGRRPSVNRPDLRLRLGERNRWDEDPRLLEGPRDPRDVLYFRTVRVPRLPEGDGGRPQPGELPDDSPDDRGRPRIRQPHLDSSPQHRVDRLGTGERRAPPRLGGRRPRVVRRGPATQRADAPFLAG